MRSRGAAPKPAAQRLGRALIDEESGLIHVIATIELQPGTRENFLREFTRVVPEVRNEDGCIEYGAAVDVGSGLTAQLPLRPDAVTIVEKWSSLDTLKAHLSAPHMLAYRPRVKDFVVRTSLQILEPVSGA